jgi:hypothetical protein
MEGQICRALGSGDSQHLVCHKARNDAGGALAHTSFLSVDVSADDASSGSENERRPVQTF